MTLVSAHRGGGEFAPRGSWQAYVAAVGLGVDLIEIDVRKRADGALVCGHDALVGGEPTVQDVLALAAGSEVGAHVDLKEAGYEAELVELTIRTGVSPVYYTTGIDESVAALRAAGAEALLTLGPALRGLSPIAKARALWRVAVPFGRITRCDARGVAAQFRLAGPLLRWWCRRRGLAVLVWTVNDDRRLRYFLHGRSVTAVVTDRPERAMALRNSG
ncbi:MAG TPA: glycerophosphodiester phosphodiesterase [Mycobacteriales bacterium]|nr:glycerophosphodiester phosphodiesterase [Mycobacteriales bacterium]